MAKQVVIIHGGTTFDNRKEYLAYLENQTIDIERLKPGYDWKLTLSEHLGGNYIVLCPKMPNSTNANYKEWTIWFENILSVINKDIILIGHSLGGIFLAKYLSEHLIDNNISKLILVAAPFTDTPEESLGSFRLKTNLSKIQQQVNNIVLIHSKDDPVVPFNDSLEYKKQLKDAKLITFDNRQHFNQQEFTELAELIKND
jgi:predicted alpha/beta hydrolase family esterase